MKNLTDAELNAKVAEQVMGWRSGGDSRHDFPIWVCRGRASIYQCAWGPSTRIADAFEVVEKMRERGWFFKLCDVIELKEWVAEFDSPFFPTCNPQCLNASAMHECAARAICLAALSALEKENGNA